MEKQKKKKKKECKVITTRMNWNRVLEQRTGIRIETENFRAKKLQAIRTEELEQRQQNKQRKIKST